MDGPVFHDDAFKSENNPNGAVQLSSNEIKNLPQLNWSNGASASFYACQSTHFASEFAGAEHVTSFGTTGYANFSANPNHFEPDNGGDLYERAFWFGGHDLGLLNQSSSMEQSDAK